MFHPKCLASLTIGAVAWLLVTPALAQPVPRSMVDLVKQSDFIGDVRISSAKDGKARVKLVESLKGQPPKGELAIDLATAEHKALREVIEQWLVDYPSMPGVLFSGKYTFSTGIVVATGKRTVKTLSGAFLHTGPWWISLDWNEKNGRWDFVRLKNVGGGGWENDTALLPDCVKYVLAAGDKAEWPLDTFIEAGPVAKVGKMTGKVYGLAAVDLTGNGRLTLFVASDTADRAFQPDRGQKSGFRDVTDSLKLASRSQFAAFADINADGRLDLASARGKVLTVWVQSEKGTFEHKHVTAKLAREAIGLSVLDVGQKGRAGLIISTDNVPLLATWTKAGRLSVAPIISLPAGTTQPADLVRADKAEPFGLARPCAVGDFDGDAIADILQPFENGGLFYKGGRDGSFDIPKSCASAAPSPRWVAFRDKAVPNRSALVRQRPNTIYSATGPADTRLADFDGDGRLDVLFLPGESNAFQWRNCGAGRFDGPMRMGQVAYICSHVTYASIGDLNNDGREDLLLTSESYEPTIHFGQGFGMFQWGGGIVRDKGIPDERGHQAGLLVDTNGDGRRDIVLVKSSADIILVPQKAGKTNGLGVRVALPTDSGFAGPLVVTGWDGDRCLGARVVTPGVEAFFGCRSAGEIALKWQYPGRPVRAQKLFIKEGVLRILLGEEMAIEPKS